MKIDIQSNSSEYAVGLKGVTFTSKKMMTALGLELIARIKRRTMAGKGPKGNNLKGYSTRPLVKKKRGRIVAKGGVPVGPDRVFYAGGYKQFKEESTGRTVVNYLLSGHTQKALRVLQASSFEAVCGPGTNEAKKITSYLQFRDPFFQVGRGDDQALVRLARFYVRQLQSEDGNRGGFGRLGRGRSSGLRGMLGRSGGAGLTRSVGSTFGGRSGGGGGAGRFRGRAGR